jgi:hypothetical protein
MVRFSTRSLLTVLTVFQQHNRPLSSGFLPSNGN